MEKTTFYISTTARVVCAKYDQPMTHSKPFVLDQSIKGKDSEGVSIDYISLTHYQTKDSRDIAYAEFGQKQAEKFYEKAMKQINA